jgi:hypothetical protein
MLRMVEGIETEDKTKGGLNVILVLSSRQSKKKPLRLRFERRRGLVVGRECG